VPGIQSVLAIIVLNISFLVYIVLNQMPIVLNQIPIVLNQIPIVLNQMLIVLHQMAVVFNNFFKKMKQR
jgi:hypothetical protein